MYRSTTTVKADLARAEFGATGEGIVWAVIAGGVDGAHPHFATFGNLDLTTPLRHLDYSTLRHDLGKEQKKQYRRGNQNDINQDQFLTRDRYAVSVPVDAGNVGTAVAGIIAGRSTDPHGTLFQGFTDRAKILSIRVLDDKGSASELNLIAALRAIELTNQNAGRLLIHGAVIPLSFGWDARNFACGRSPICAEVDRLVNSGVVVVTSVGNRSFDSKHDRIVEGGITDPGNSELALSVGSTHRSAPEIYGPSFFSCRGPTADGRIKPDLLAPGERVRVCVPPFRAPAPPDSDGSRRRKRDGQPAPRSHEGEFIHLDGTEIAAAHVAGAAAVVLSAQPGLAGKPQELKDLLLRTAVDLRRDRTYQGHGLVDVLAAVKAAVGSEKSSSSPARALKVFVSYSHKDLALWKEFGAHLTPMERSGRIEVWSDLKLEAGKPWEKEIFARLEGADIILLLVSAHFFESNFAYSKEMKRALDRDVEGSARVVPVLVRPVSLKGTVFAEIQVVPQGARPITSFGDPHEGWTQVADLLFDIVESRARTVGAVIT
jgi:subtilisin family serine protease